MPAPRLLFTIDVEEDMPSWKITNPIATTNARALPDLQRLCEEYGLRPTYLCDYPMVSQPESAQIIRQLARSSPCEIGTHLHPWNTPPYNGIPGRNVDERTIPYYLRDLGPDLFRQKLQTLTDAIGNLTGNRPLSFRAGRFGIDAATLAVLPECGYLYDSSVTPLAEHGADGGPDFRRAPVLPYYPHRRDICRRGDLPILEIPVSVALTRKLPEPIQNLYIRIPKAARLRGLLSKDYLNFVDYAWLYPVRFDTPEMIRAASTLRALGSPVLNLFLHSSEIVPGMSGAVKDQAAVEQCMARLRGIIEFCLKELRAAPATLSEAGAEVEAWLRHGSPGVLKR
jgi:hypothetical protein